MIKRVWFVIPLAMVGLAMGPASTTSAETTDITPIESYDLDAEISTSDGDVTTNVYETPSVRDATGTHATFTKVSSHTTKHKYLKGLVEYVKGPGNVSFSTGRSFSGSATVSYGAESVGFGFSGTASATYSFKVPAGRFGTVGYYADVTATRYLIKLYSNLNNSLVSTHYSTSVSLSNKYYGLHLK